MIEITVDKGWAEKAVRWACRRLQYTIDRPNMNPRSLAERLDDIVMGEIGSAAVAQFLVDRGNRVIAYDEVRKDGSRQPDPGWDLVVGPALDGWPYVGDDVRMPPESAHTISVRTSRIPKADEDSIDLAIERRDFKVFKKSEMIEDDLSSDYETQIFYRLSESKMKGIGNITEVPYIVRAAIEGSRYVGDEEFKAINRWLHLRERYGKCFLVGFISKEALTDYSRLLIESQEPTCWNSWHGGESKEMWRAPLSLGKLP